MSDGRQTTLATAEPERDDPARTSAAIVERAGRSSGRLLDSAMRAYMEPRFGHDFGRVRVHTDARAAATARELRADAFTSGQDIWFATGRYNGDTAAGRRLIAHELAHTLQQRAPGSSAVVQLYRSGTTLDDPLEREADSAARRVGSGGSLAPGEVSVGVPGARLEVARQTSAQAVEDVEPPAVIDALAEGMRAALEDDPYDRTRRVSAQLRRLAARTRAGVVARLRARLSPALAQRLAEILAAPAPPDAERPLRAAQRPEGAAPERGRTPREARPTEGAAPERGRTPRVARPTEGSAAEGGRPRPGAPAAAVSETADGEAPAGAVAEGETTDAWRAAATGAEPVVRPEPAAVAAVESAVKPATGLPADPAAGLAQPAEPESTARAEAAEAANTPEKLAAEGAPPEGAEEQAAEPEEAPAVEGAMAEEPPTAEGAPPGAPEGTDESIPDATVDPAASEETAEERREDAEDNEALAEAESAPPTPATVAPAPEAAAAPAEAEAAPGGTAEPRAPAPPAGGPDAMPADAEGGAPVPSDEQELAAESAVDDSVDEAPLTTTGANPSAVPVPLEAEDEGEAGASEPPGPEGSVESEPDSAEQGGEPAAGPENAEALIGKEAAALFEQEEAALEEGGGDGGGGGGGASAIEEPPPPEVPDVAGAEPEAAIDQVAALPPTAAAAALGGVSSAATKSVGTKRDELAANPPEMERPSGAPSPAEAAAEAAAPPAADTGPAAVERTPEGPASKTPDPAPLPPAPAPPTAAVRDPNVGTADAKMTEAEAARIRDSVRALPTSDPALNVTAGDPPPLVLEGDSDPKRAAEQRAALDKATGEARTQGAADGAAPMGEAAVLPDVPAEKLRAEITSAGAAGGGAGGGGAGGAAAGAGGAGAAGAVGGGTDIAIDAIIEEQQPGQIQAGAATARGQMATARQEHATAVETANADSRTAVEGAITDNASQQRAERTAIRADVRGKRGDWTKAQQDVVDKSQKDADKEGTKAATDIATERDKGTRKAAEHIDTGNEDVKEARNTAEQEAADQKRKGEEESGGILGWVASKAKAFFDGIKNAIKKAFEAARAAVREAIEKAKKLAAEVIEAARKAIVEAIKAVGEALVAIGDFVLAAFPELREKFRKLIEDAVQAAVDKVNELADDLKEAVEALLDGLGAAIDAALGLLEAGLLAAVDAYAAVVTGAIEAAQAVLKAIGDLAEIAKDVAAGPANWVRNLGAAIADGIQNHLWAALKAAVQAWFNGKVESVLGLGTMIWNVLKKGGIGLAQIGKFAFNALKTAIPIALLKLLVEKLVGMLVPAAAAVMAIIEGLQAAWGTVSQLLQAFSKFIAFLKAVKGGGAGPQFAEMLAAAAVVVIEFVSNWLLARLLKPIAKVAGAIKKIAGKIGAKLKKLMRAVKRGFKKVTKKLKRFVKRQKKRFPKLARKKRAGKGAKKDKRQRQQDRLNRAVAAIRPPLEAMLRKGTSRTMLRARLAWWRLRWRLSSLGVAAGGKITARINPEAEMSRAEEVKLGQELEQILIAAENAYFRGLEARLSPERRAALEEAETRLKVGDPRADVSKVTTDLPELTRAEQTLLLRRIQSGEIPPWQLARQRGTKWPTATFGGGAGGTMTITQPQAMSTAHVKVPGGRGKYTDIVPNLQGIATGGGVSESDVLSVVRAPSPAAQRDRLSALMAGKTPEQQAALTAGMGLMEQTGFLTQAVEPARAPGQFAAAGIGQHVGDIEEAIGKGPMAPVGAAGTSMEEERKRRFAQAEATRPAELGPATSREEVMPGRLPKTTTPPKQEALIAERRARIAQIFQRLRAAVRSGAIDALAGSEAQAMRRISEAFEKWLARRTSGDPDELAQHAAALQAQIEAWMRSFHG